MDGNSTVGKSGVGTGSETQKLNFTRLRCSLNFPICMGNGPVEWETGGPNVKSGSHGPTVQCQGFFTTSLPVYCK